MRVCAKKNVVVEDKKIFKHEEGTLVAVTRNTMVSDEYFYLVDFKEHGRLLVRQADFDILER